MPALKTGRVACAAGSGSRSAGVYVSGHGGGIASGLRVVEIGNSAALSVAGVVLADAGAEVIMVEPPGGSPLRDQPAFAMWARGKQSMVADLTQAPDRARVMELIGEADVCMIGLKPASTDRFGLAYEALRAVGPRLVVARLSGFGYQGPYRDIPVYDGVMQARGGRMLDFSSLAGGERPAFTAVPVTAHAAAAAMVLGVFAALRERERDGRGQLVETSLTNALSVYDLLSWAPGSSAPQRREDAPFLPYANGRTADGIWIQFAQNGPALFADFLRALDLDHELDAAALYASTDPAVKRAVRARVLERVASKTWAQWQQCFSTERNLSVERFHAPGDALRHPQFLAIGDTVELHDPVHGDTSQLGPMIDVPANPLLPRGAAPSLDSRADTERSEATFAPTNSHSRGDELPGSGLLAGVTVIELGMWIALPFAAAQLADLGARVIKLEPLGGDPMRATGAVAMKIVQGKQSVMIDLKAPAARDIVHRLIARADVLMHSYRPGVPERLGIDFETVRAINPRIVYLYNGSYGSTGPKAYAPAFHVTGGAVAGGAYAQAGAGCPPPPDRELESDETIAVSRRLALANEANPDFNSAVVAAAAVAMGLYAQSRTGEAISLETRMMLSCAWTMSEHFIDYDGRPARPEPDAGLHGLSALYRLYQTTDGWVFLAAPRPRDFLRLCDALGIAHLAADNRFSTAEARAANDEALAHTLAATFARHEADALETELTTLGVACVRADYGTYSQWLFAKEWAEQQGMVVDAPDSIVGPYRRHGPVVHSQHPHRPGGARAAGADTHGVLSELGYSDQEIDAFIAAGVVASAGSGGSP